MRMTRRQALAIGAAAPVALAASAARGATWQVQIKGFKFIPADLTVAAGDTVVFANASGRHTATALDGSFDTGTLRKGESGEIILSAKGAYPYRCIFHKSMTGTITVA